MGFLFQGLGLLVLQMQGIIIICDTKNVEVKDSVVGEFTISIRINLNEGEEWWLLGVYGPCKKREMNLLWKELAGLYGLCSPNCYLTSILIL